MSARKKKKASTTSSPVGTGSSITGLGIVSTTRETSRDSTVNTTLTSSNRDNNTNRDNTNRDNTSTSTTSGVASASSTTPVGASAEGFKLSETLQQCHTILKQLQAKPDAQPFLDPVDWEAYNLTDYPEIIKKPMDLGTIQGKLEIGKYSSAEKFASDVRLVWKNAMTYNRSDSDIYMTADLLSKLFEKKFAKIKKATKRRASEIKSESREGSRAEKVKLSQLVNQLDSDQLGEMVSIIQRECPDALNEEEDEVLEIEINSLDTQTLSNLNTFATNCIEAQKKKKK